MSRIAYVSGRLAAGKSTLAAPLAAELGYSLVTKDLIKETLHDALFRPGKEDAEPDLAWSMRLSAVSWELLFALAARAGDMVIEANFQHRELERERLRGLGDRVVEVRCECPAEVAVARYNARHPRHPAHGITSVTLAGMAKYDRPVGIGPLITVDTSGPVDVALVAAEVRRLHSARTIRG